MADLGLLLVPLAAGILVLLSHVPLGEQVLRRGVVFIDLAIAQLAAFGVLVAGSFTAGAALASLAGCSAALTGAGLVAWLSRMWPSRREALIGLVYVAGAVLALIWVSADPRGTLKLSAMLSGDILWVTWPDLAPLALATCPFLAAYGLRPSLLSRSRVFYPAFAILVSLSVPLLGIYLVFSTLIVPALAVRADRRRGWCIAVAWGAAAYVMGLLASLRWDLPSGACVVMALVAMGTFHGLTIKRRLAAS